VVAALTVAARAASRGIRNNASGVASKARSAENASGTVVGQRTAVDLSFAATLETGFWHSGSIFAIAVDRSKAALA
jgi:hypothetical protein